MKILLAGDNFVRNDVLARAITARVPDAPTFSTLALPWPQTPFGRVAEVDEASDRENELAAAVSDREVVITQMAPMTERVIAAARALKLIVCARGGPVNVNIPAATARGIAVSATPGRNATAVAEYTVLLMLAAIRRLPEIHASMVAGEWRSSMYAYDDCGTEIAGSVVGVVGLGEVGRRVAAIVRAMGAAVVAFDPFVAPGSAGEGIDMVELHELLARANVITLHARLTDETRGLIGASALARVTPGTVLVNTARGGLLDYGAATRAIGSGRLAALALDVYPEEPLPPASPLLRMPHVVLSPHLAGATRETAERAVTMAAEEVGRYARREPLAYVLNGLRPRRQT